MLLRTSRVVAMRRLGGVAELPSLCSASALRRAPLGGAAARPLSDFVTMRDRNFPKKGRSAYALFCAEEFAANPRPESVSAQEWIGTMSKRNSGAWKALKASDDAADVQRVAGVQRRAAEEKAAFARAVEGYQPPRGYNKEGVKKKRLRDPKEPKRPPNGYILFVNSVRDEIVASIGGAVSPENLGQIGKQAGLRWNGLPEATKAQWVEQAKAARARYDVELAAYRASQQQEEED